MPSRKDLYDEAYSASDEYEDTFSVQTDEDSIPYINSELHDLGMHHEKIKWIDSVQDDAIEMYKSLQQFKENSTCSHFFEKLTYNRFLIFLSQNSYQRV